MSKKIALITGATSGIGKATALLLAKHDFSIIACGRRQERLDELKSVIEAAGSEVITLLFDVRERAQVYEAISGLPESWQQIDLLVNNAGNAHGLAPIQEGVDSDWDAMIDINVKGLLNVSKMVMSGMIERKSGQIINIGSVAGKEVYPNGNIYCASKHAVDAITAGMRMDLFKDGIRVAAINPGLVETEFSLVRFKGDAERAAKVYEGYKALAAEDIADIVLFMATRPAHVNIADVLVFPAGQASSMLVDRKV